MTRYILEAPAKVNLFLGVESKRDGDRHLLKSVFQTISLFDRLEVEVKPNAFLPGISLNTCFASGVTAINLPAEDNLVYRATHLLAEQIGYTMTESLNVRLVKNIPLQAGLGGGSSDCAAMLLFLSQIWNLDPRGDAIQRTASALGSDINFFLDGGCALFDRFGDRFVRALNAPALDFVLVKPEFGISTGAVYRAFDGAPSPASAPDALIAALAAAADNPEAASADVVSSALANNLSDAARAVEPTLARVFEAIAAIDSNLHPLLCGSGSTVFALCRDARAAADVADHLHRKGFWAMTAKSVAHGVRLVEK